MAEKNKSERTAADQSIEVLQERYGKLNTRKIQAETNLENAHRQLETLKEEAREKYGTDDVETLLARARLPRASRVPRGLLEHPWSATLALAASAFVAVGTAGVANSGRAGLAGAAALAAVEASLIVLSFVAFGRTLGLRDAARDRAR